MSTSTTESQSVRLEVSGTRIPDEYFLSYTIDRDMFQPDMAAITISNRDEMYTSMVSNKQIKIGDEVTVKIGEDQKLIFWGEVMGLEPAWDGPTKKMLLVRAMNKMHRMLRVRKSQTFNDDQDDQQIMSKVIKDAGLVCEWEVKGVDVKYKHVYQHNQTDLEFLRVRAARIGAHLFCYDNTKVKVFTPQLDQGPIGKLSVQKADSKGVLVSFRPRMSAASIVKKVTVKGWDPEKKDLHTGEAKFEGSQLGTEKATDAVKSLAGEETFTVDHPIWSKQEAKILAKARMQETALTFITGEAELYSDPVYDLGKIVEIKSHLLDNSDPFNGKYYIMGLAHTYLSTRKEGKARTILKLARDMQKEG